ncbi:hypothetical protein ACWDUL_06575 [Nocardia niigatensis]|uniref:hypothetical protein n=1 Tax=Nocardia niigatensis TaxID=209249 RepID=UPI000307BEB7|nr:hypothetical protein [Nocardia niigatensis]
MHLPLRTTVAATAVFAGLLAPAAVAAADALPLTPAQPTEQIAGGPSFTGSVNTGPTGTGSFDPSPTGSSNLIKAFQTGSGQCNSGAIPFPVMDGSAAPWCGLYH